MLAPEILSDIFGLALPDDETHTHLKTEAPLNASQVSRSWRQLAISTSSLWSRISFICGDDEPSWDTSKNRVQQIHQTLRAWDTWIERSKTRPLKITVVQMPNFFPGEQEAVSLLLDKAMLLFHRWHDVELTINRRNYLALVPDFPATLERLALLNVEIYPISLVPAPTLPRLQSSRGGRVIGDVIIPRVRVSRFAGPQSNLQLLGLEDRVVTVHSLRCLTINREFSSELESALRRTVLPSLSELTISLDDGYDDSPTGIYPLIQRSNASLKLLRLIHVGIEYDELYGVLRESPMLETLCMLDCTSYAAEDDVINILTIQNHLPEEVVLCPRLSKITFGGWHIENTRDADRLVDMVESRWNITRFRNQPAILSIDLTNCLRVEPSSSRRDVLARCISEGLEYKSRSE